MSILTINIADIKFYVVDNETDKELTNKDGTLKLFGLKESIRFKPLEYLTEGMNMDMLEEI